MRKDELNCIVIKLHTHQSIHTLSSRYVCHASGIRLEALGWSQGAPASRAKGGVELEDLHLVDGRTFGLVEKISEGGAGVACGALFYQLLFHSL